MLFHIKCPASKNNAIIQSFKQSIHASMCIVAFTIGTNLWIYCCFSKACLIHFENFCHSVKLIFWKLLGGWLIVGTTSCWVVFWRFGRHCCWSESQTYKAKCTWDSSLLTVKYGIRTLPIVMQLLFKVKVSNRTKIVPSSWQCQERLRKLWCDCQWQEQKRDISCAKKISRVSAQQHLHLQKASKPRRKRVA